MTFNFAKFDPKEMTRSPACVAIVGKRGTGKSMLIKDLLYHLNLAGVPRCICFSATEEANSYFGTFLPSVFVHPLDPDTLDRVWKAQKELVLQKRVGQLNPDTDTRLVLVMDDCAYHKQMMKSATLREIFMNGRHHGIYFIVTLQYLIDLNVAMRSNVDCWFYLKELSHKNQERIYNESCGFLPSFLTFQDLFMASTANYEAFVVNSRCKSNDPQKIVAHYRADANLNFKYGAPALWRYHDEVYESASDKYQRLQRTQQDSRPMSEATRSRKGGNTIIVRRQG
ncbi:hypothetical protein JKP88DRAFT_157617 [Tribonema minus]|uniref:Zona occludens toxin N-terminal domain-containing protein n=1 Tax=Tribonema minus TaxID=303371 RepID=A0A835YWY0_9STRA|nr:hypothetical protein JKP88DRAFT_157617 [Tribonema minus]